MDYTIKGPKMKRKRFWGLTIIIAVLLCVGVATGVVLAYQQQNSEKDKIWKAAVLQNDGTETILVYFEDKTTTLCHINLNGAKILDADKKALSLNDILVGSTVEIRGIEVVLESFPATITKISSLILASEPDKVLYEEGREAKEDFDESVSRFLADNASQSASLSATSTGPSMSTPAVGATSNPYMPSYSQPTSGTQYPFDELVDDIYLYLDYPVAKDGHVSFHVQKYQGWIFQFFFAEIFPEFGSANEGACLYREWDSELQYQVGMSNDGPFLYCLIDTETWTIKESSYTVYEDTELPEGVPMEISEERRLEIGLEFWDMMQEAEEKYTALGGEGWSFSWPDGR